MKISEGGIGAPLSNVLREVVRRRAARAGGFVPETSLEELARLVQETDLYTSRSMYSNTMRLRTASTPTLQSVRRNLEQMQTAGLIAIESLPQRRLSIAVLRPLKELAEWEDEHEPTRCQCHGSYSCPLHSPLRWVREHKACPPEFCCHAHGRIHGEQTPE